MAVDIYGRTTAEAEVLRDQAWRRSALLRPGWYKHLGLVASEEALQHEGGLYMHAMSRLREWVRGRAGTFLGRNPTRAIEVCPIIVTAEQASLILDVMTFVGRPWCRLGYDEPGDLRVLWVRRKPRREKR